MNFKVGQKVYWNNPAIDDYPDDEKTTAFMRVYIIYKVDNRNRIAFITDEEGYSEAEVFTDELEPI